MGGHGPSPGAYPYRGQPHRTAAGWSGLGWARLPDRLGCRLGATCSCWGIPMASAAGTQTRRDRTYAFSRGQPSYRTHNAVRRHGRHHGLASEGNGSIGRDGAPVDMAAFGMRRSGTDPGHIWSSCLLPPLAASGRAAAQVPMTPRQEPRSYLTASGRWKVKVGTARGLRP